MILAPTIQNFQTHAGGQSTLLTSENTLVTERTETLPCDDGLSSEQEEILFSCMSQYHQDIIAYAKLGINDRVNRSIKGSEIIRNVLSSFYALSSSFEPGSESIALRLFNETIANQDFTIPEDEWLSDRINDEHNDICTGLKGELKTMLTLCHDFGYENVIIPRSDTNTFPDLHPDLILKIGRESDMKFVMIEVKTSRRGKVLPCAGDLKDILRNNMKDYRFQIDALLNYPISLRRNELSARAAWRKYRHRYPNIQFIPMAVLENTSDEFNRSLHWQVKQHLRFFKHSDYYSTSTY